MGILLFIIIYCFDGEKMSCNFISQFHYIKVNKHTMDLVQLMQQFIDDYDVNPGEYDVEIINLYKAYVDFAKAYSAFNNDKNIHNWKIAKDASVRVIELGKNPDQAIAQIMRRIRKQSDFNDVVQDKWISMQLTYEKYLNKIRADPTNNDVDEHLTQDEFDKLTHSEKLSLAIPRPDWDYERPDYPDKDDDYDDKPRPAFVSSNPFGKGKIDGRGGSGNRRRTRNVKSSTKRRTRKMRRTRRRIIRK
jgi:hypothetical protein